MSDSPVAVRLTEVGPRDGLQNEPETIPTAAKIAFVNALSRTGVEEIEVSSFVSPKWVPQLADAEEVFRGIERVPGVTYCALVPNEKGLERALAAGAEKIHVFTAATETFSRKNTNASVRESLARLRPVVRRAREERLPVRGYVSTAFHCPYEGFVDPERVLPVVEELGAMGVEEISLADTDGRASPPRVRALLDRVLARVPPERVNLHLHDTYGLAIANALVAWAEYGIRSFDASAGGLGGCPFAPGAAGNVATEDLIHALRACGAEVAADPARVVAALQTVIPHLKRPVASRLSRALARGCGPAPTDPAF